MIYSLYFQMSIVPDQKRILEIFFQDWADGICNNEVTYSVESTQAYPSSGIIRADFVNEEDAMMLKLKGIPDEFKGYLTLV